MRLALLSLLISSPAFAAGFFVHDVGHVGISRQGAVVASGDDLSALWYNPANLSAGRGLRLQVDVNLNWKNIDWQRGADPLVQSAPFPSAHNRFAPIPVPTIAAAYDFNVPGLALAFGLYAPNNSSTIFDAGGPQRYSVVRSGSFLIFFHLALSYQPLPWLRFGAGLYATSVFFDQRLAVNVGIGGPEARDFDIYVDVYGVQHFLMNANAGVWISPGGGFEIGATVLPGRKAQARGLFHAEPGKALASLLTVNGDSGEFQVNLPWIARTGVAWRLQDVFVGEVAFVYEGWSSLSNILIRPQNVSLSAPPIINNYVVGDISLDRSWHDSFSLRIGAKGLVYRPLDLRVSAGYGYETGAVPDQVLSVASNDTVKHNIGVGVSMSFDRWKVGLAYGHSFYLPRNVTDSRLKLTNPLTPTDASVIGNGQYTFSHDIVSVSVGVGLL